MEREVRVLKALGDETRFKIVLFLLNGRKSVSSITQHVQKAQPTVSLQLKLLEMSGLIKSEREGKYVFYQIHDKIVFAVIKALRGKKFKGKLKALGDETRFKTILFLLNGRKSVSEITGHVQKAQPTVSLQLKLLEMSGLIKSEREGKYAFYQIHDKIVFNVVKALGVAKSQN